MSSLRAGLVSQVLQSAQSTTHPLRAVCEAYFISTASLYLLQYSSATLPITPRRL
ncbi:MAG: hypothetical protein KatS3mg038_3510 [Candidatus Kapaibacterium sp.]|nr:MAG: hypothetical protein KatS3mg038_3510 [Candidatus Kapabacteria bacterium]